MLSIAVLLSVLALLTLGCNPDGSEASTPDSRVTAELHAQRLLPETARSIVVADSTVLRRPRLVATTHDFVVVADAATDSLLIVFSADSHSLVGTAGNSSVTEATTGRSLTAWSIDPVPGTADRFRVFDPILNRILTIGVSSADPERHLTAVEPAASVVQPLYLPDGRFVSTGLRLQRRYALFTPDGRVLREFGGSPPGEDSVTLAVRQHAYSSRGVLHPRDRRLALATRYGDRLQVFDSAGAMIAEADRAAGFDPVYDVGTRGGYQALALRDNSRIGYVMLAADSGHIYALYSGRAIGSFGNDAFVGERVHVFGWNGRLRRVLRLAGETLAIAASSDGRWLYAVEPPPVSRLLAYRLEPTQRPDELAAR